MSKDDAEVLHNWQRSQTVKRTVYIVYCDTEYEGSALYSVHATKAGADVELAKVKAEHKGCDMHSISAEEVQP